MSPSNENGWKPSQLRTTARRGTRVQTDAVNIRSMPRPPRRACMVCKEIHVLLACKRFLEFLRWRRHQRVRQAGANVSNVSSVTIEWRVVGPIPNVASAIESTIGFFIWKQQEAGPGQFSDLVPVRPLSHERKLSGRMDRSTSMDGWPITWESPEQYDWRQSGLS